MVAMPRRMAAIGERRVTSSPRQRMVPVSGWWAPASTLIRVDFPAPFWPSRQCTSPAWTSRSTPSRARTPGNDLVMPDMLSSGGCGAMRIPLGGRTGRCQGDPLAGQAFSGRAG